MILIWAVVDLIWYHIGCILVNKESELISNLLGAYMLHDSVESFIRKSIHLVLSLLLLVIV